MSETHKGVLLTLVAGISWGLISLFIRPLEASGLTPLNITNMRDIGAALFLLCSVPFMNKRAFRVKPKDLWCMAGGGFICLVLFPSLYFTTIKLTTVNIAVVLLYTSPVFVTLMSCFFFKEKFTLRKLLALVLVFVGCALVAGILAGEGTVHLSFKVLLIGLASGFTYALYSIFSRAAQNRGYTSDVITMWTFLFAALLSLFLIDYRHVGSVLKDVRLAFTAVGFVLVSTILPYCTYTAGLKRLQPSCAAIIVTIETVVGTIVGTICFGEPLTFHAIFGMVLVLASCCLCI